MIQVHTCVSVHCDQCGDALGSPDLELHYRSERLALRAAAAERWRIDGNGQRWCSVCAPLLTCDAEGHQFTPWRVPRTREGPPGPSEYRYCRWCCSLESRPASQDRRDGGESR